MTRPSTKISLGRDRLLRFRDELHDLLGRNQDEGDERITDADFNRVAVAGGEALQAYAENGGRLLTVQEGIYLHPNVNPIARWTLLFEEDSDLSPANVFSALNTAIGRAQERYETARARERGLIGLVGAVLRWPADLREATGPGRGQQRAATSIGIIGQILVGAAAATLSVVVVQCAVLIGEAFFSG